MTPSPILRLSLEFLEVMVLRACNLSCQGCTTFSDLQHSGYVPWDTGRSWIQSWSPRLDIKAIGVMGGEPLINPDIYQWLHGMRQILPQAQIRFVTNGLLLHKHQGILDFLDGLGNCVLKISYHLKHQTLNSNIQKMFASRSWTPITECGISRWISETGLRLQISRPRKFFKTFAGSYETMRPHNNEPSQAFEICVQKKCPLLYQGRIWKCGTLALTPDLLDRMNNPNIDLWSPYLESGLGPDCSTEDLEKFVFNFGRPHKMCRQCPSINDSDSILDHGATVTFK